MAAKKKRMQLGGGGRFAAIEAKAKASGARDPAAVAASVGIKAHGKSQMQQWAKAGKARAKKRKAGTL